MYVQRTHQRCSSFFKKKHMLYWLCKQLFHIGSVCFMPLENISVSVKIFIHWIIPLIKTFENGDRWQKVRTIPQQCHRDRKYGGWKETTLALLVVYFLDLPYWVYKLIYEELHIIHVYNFINLDICKYPWSQHQN